MPSPSDSLSAKVADFAVFCAEIAEAQVHHARIGERRAPRFRRIERQSGPLLHIADDAGDNRGRNDFFGVSGARHRMPARDQVPSDQEAR